MHACYCTGMLQHAVGYTGKKESQTYTKSATLLKVVVLVVAMPMKLGPSSVPCMIHNLFMRRTILSIWDNESPKAKTVPRLSPSP